MESQAAALRESAGTGTVAGNLTAALTALFGSVAREILGLLIFRDDLRARLREASRGRWEGFTFDEIKQSEPEQYAAWMRAGPDWRFPGGESLQDVVARTSNALRHTLARHSGSTVVLVGHDSVNRALLLQLLDQPLSAYWRLAQSPCCINEIDIAGGRIEVLRVNDTQHLGA